MTDKKLAGIGDRPIAKFKHELLGLTEYANALTEFVQTCDTPLTLGLQGDWGSGKTSLMNLMRRNFEKSGDEKIRAVWIDTWMYAQLGDGQTLFLEVLGGVVDGLAEARGTLEKAAAASKDLKTYKAALWKTIRTAAVVARGADLAHLEGDAKPGYRVAEELKNELSKMVGQAAGEDGRVVLFVDDLDRVPPERAVQILEALKNFLDVPGLVTVLACDYGVISRGLGARMGVTEEELGRSFFDKIIQVPFRMPVHSYRAAAYIDDLLRKVQIKASKEEVALATQVVQHSVGLNPRSMKRHANTLMLLMSVAKRAHGEETNIHEGRRPLVMLALTLMQATYPAAHRYLARLLEDDGEDARREIKAFLLQRELPDPAVEPWTQSWVEDGDDGDREATGQLGLFLGALTNLVDENGDQEFSDDELRVLQEMAHLSKVSSVEAQSSEPPRKKKLGDSAFVVAVGSRLKERLVAIDSWRLVAKGSMAAEYLPFAEVVGAKVNPIGRTKVFLEFWMARPGNERAMMTVNLAAVVAPSRGAIPPAWLDRLQPALVESLRARVSGLPEHASVGTGNNRVVARIRLPVEGVAEPADDDEISVGRNQASVDAAAEFAALMSSVIVDWCEGELPGILRQVSGG